MCEYCEPKGTKDCAEPLPMNGRRGQFLISKNSDGYALNCTISISTGSLFCRDVAEFGTVTKINFCPICARDLRKD